MSGYSQQNVLNISLKNIIAPISKIYSEKWKLQKWWIILIMKLRNIFKTA